MCFLFKVKDEITADELVSKYQLFKTIKTGLLPKLRFVIIYFCNNTTLMIYIIKAILFCVRYVDE